MSEQGHFVWFNLVTNDVAAAKAFYGGIAGWETKGFPGANYDLWTVGGVPVGGLVQDAVASPHWVGYVQTANADEAVEKVTHRGGKVLEPPMDIPGDGRFATLADPQGAPFGVYAPTARNDDGSPRVKGVGSFGWAELHTTDWESAWRFYGELFGWTEAGRFDMGTPWGTYFMFGRSADHGLGGMFNGAHEGNAAPRWLHYIQVPNADEAAKQLVKAGGNVLVGPADVPGGGRMVQGLDPQGAAFAVYSER